MGIRRFVVGLSIAAAAAHAAAQGNYPEQPVRILVGFTAGVAPDVTARLLAEKLGAAWGKPVVVENITGAGGNIAADRLAKSPPTPAEFAAAIERETPRWASVIKQAGIKASD